MALAHCLNLNFPTKPNNLNFPTEPNRFTSTTRRFHPNPLNTLTSIVYNTKPIMHSLSRSVQALIKSSLIEFELDGGKLVDLVVPETDRAERVLEALFQPMAFFLEGK
ncbi:hypothetical protein TorRG33x02_226780 [Trema orientale]|uniref:Uncharacterized protein n=1 Tax=Trema orientale TaxID=63057 RepID=A0A2P5E7Q3_TREOI|nr:hypothetical protein TorRG33x02_226780 [Trema orientale]